MDVELMRRLVDTIVVVMMENRSFDHMLGYLNLPAYGARDVDGIRDEAAWRQKFANPNPADGFRYPPLHLRYFWIQDPPHERSDIKTQLGTPASDGTFPLDGFIASAKGDSSVMGYYEASDIPITDFLARYFAVCSRWFASLPAGTQPNRLMAMSGFTPIDTNRPLLLDDQELVYDWLNDRGIPWRVYHDGSFPFFSLMPKWMPQIASGEKFRSLDRLQTDFDFESDATFPKVVFIEPTYTCSRVGTPCDDHCPTPVLPGQNFLLRVYKALTSNYKRWYRTVIIVTYDEHGGFFDHVQPIELETVAPEDVYPVFETSGVRVPAIVVSPLVTPGKLYGQNPGDKNLDHTSILKFIAQRFDANASYSPDVDKRNVGSVADVLDQTTPIAAIPFAPAPNAIPTPSSLAIAPAPNPHAEAFQKAVVQMTQNFSHELVTKHPNARDLLGLKPT